MSLMRLMRVMGRQSSLLSHYYGRLSTWNRMLLVWTLMIGLIVPSSHTLSLASGNGKQARNDTEVKLPAAASDLRPARTNSRFLRNFPPYDFIDFARRNGVGEPSSKRAFVNGNSPVFYIRLPPAPYVLVPGLGYISPHPYNSNSPAFGSVANSPNSVIMSPDVGGSGDMPMSSKEQSLNNNVISLPLKFLSNGRPAQIESPRPVKKQPPKKTIENSKITTALLSGGKYSFNGRPNGVFIVRSPVSPTAPASMGGSYINLH